MPIIIVILMTSAILNACYFSPLLYPLFQKRILRLSRVLRLCKHVVADSRVGTHFYCCRH